MTTDREECTHMPGRKGDPVLKALESVTIHLTPLVWRQSPSSWLVDVECNASFLHHQVVLLHQCCSDRETVSKGIAGWRTVTRLLDEHVWIPTSWRCDYSTGSPSG